MGQIPKSLPSTSCPPNAFTVLNLGPPMTNHETRLVPWTILSRIVLLPPIWKPVSPIQLITIFQGRPNLSENFKGWKICQICDKLKARKESWYTSYNRTTIISLAETKNGNQGELMQTFSRYFWVYMSCNRIGTIIPALHLIDKTSSISVNNNDDDDDNDRCLLVCKYYVLGTMLTALLAMSIRMLAAVRVPN